MNNITGLLKKEADKYQIIASTADVDRDGEIIQPAAFKNLKTYLKNNPVILGFHDYHSFPIGKAVSGKIGEKDLQLSIEFAETTAGKEAKYLYDNGFMNSFSVGFIPKEWDIDKNGRRVYTDVELLEVSAVPVPANAAANIIRTVKDFNFSILKRIANEEHYEPSAKDDSGKNSEAEKIKRSLINGY